MQTLMRCLRSNICHKNYTFNITSLRGRKFWPIPPDFSHIELPPLEDRALPPLEPIPNFHGVRPVKMPKYTFHVQGPEVINNQLLYKQFGIMALTGGHIAPNHIDYIRTKINKFMDVNRMFALWRIEPPWKPISRRSQGKRHGGGKGNIHHYATPVRAGHVILEIGGHCEYEEVVVFLEKVSNSLPCDAIPISEAILEKWKNEEDNITKRNINPFTFERIVRLNMNGCKQWISPYDQQWFGKYD